MTILAGCSLVTSDDTKRPPERILFIGNSLTDANRLPELVKAMAQSAGLPELTVGTELLDGTNLADHWNGLGPAMVDQGWDVVVMQQGPTSRAADRVELRMVAARFATRIRAAGGEPAMFSVWPMASDPDDFAKVSESFHAAAQDVDGYLFPVGDAWLEAWRRDVAMPLYSADNFHPSAYGTYVAALTIFGVTYRRSVVGLPSRYILTGGTSIWINPLDARVLQDAVDVTVRRYGRRPR